MVMDCQAYNYNSLANTNDNSCYPIIEGCFDETAYNYNDYDNDNHPNELSGDDFSRYKYK